MLGASWHRLRLNLTKRALRTVIVRSTTRTIFCAILLGAGLGQLLASAGQDDRIVVGNTGGTLSSIIRVDDTLIVFGGGSARSDLADLLGRSTFPWQRHVDLLIIPGWDDQQALGALGLLERESVSEIVILGQPATTNIWTVLYQTASSHAVPIDVATNQNRIEISSAVRLELAASDPLSSEAAEFALLTLHFHADQLTFLDASAKGVTAMNRTNVVPSRTHGLVLSRASSGLATESALRIQPSATHSSDFELASSSYQRELARGEHIAIGLDDNQLRLDLNAVERVGDAPAASPTID